MNVKCSNCRNTEHPTEAYFCMICGEKLKKGVRSDKTTDQSFEVDFGSVNLKQLVLTNDVNRYEQLKAQGNIGVLFEPSVVSDVDAELTIQIYLVGIQQDK